MCLSLIVEGKNIALERNYYLMKMINKFKIKIKSLLYSLSLSRSILFTRNRNIRLKRSGVTRPFWGANAQGLFSGVQRSIQGGAES